MLLYPSVACHPAIFTGELTLGENAADNGCARFSLMALETEIGDKLRPEIAGFIPDAAGHWG